MKRAQVWAIACVTACLMLGLGLIAPLLPLLRDEFSLTGSELGLLVAAFPAARVGFAYLAGVAVDRFGLRRLGVVSCLVAAGSAAAAPGASSPTTLIAVLFGMGLGSVFYSAAAAAHVLESAGARRAGRAMGSYQTVTLVGGAMGPVLGAFAGSYLSLRAPFLIYAALSALGAVATWLAIEEPAPGGRVASDRATVTRLHGPGSPVRRVHLVVALIAVTVFASRQGHVNTLVPIQAYDDLGLSVGLIGCALGASVLATVVAVPHAGRLADRGLSRRLILVFVTGLGGCVLLLGLSPPAVLLFATLVAYGACTAYLLIAPQVLLFEWSAPGRRGRAVGAQRTASALGMVLGPMAAGYAVQVGRVTAAFVIGSAVLLATAAAASLLPRTRPDEDA